jgi:hypothetical protein
MEVNVTVIRGTMMMVLITKIVRNVTIDVRVVKKKHFVKLVLVYSETNSVEAYAIVIKGIMMTKILIKIVKNVIIDVRVVCRNHFV